MTTVFSSAQVKVSMVTNVVRITSAVKHRPSRNAFGPVRISARIRTLLGYPHLSDFRSVKQNFRDLDRQLRERIAQWEGGKGDLVAELVSDRDAISASGRRRAGSV